MLTDEQVINFQSIFKKRFGKDISREEAFEKSAKLIRLVELIYKPINSDDYRKLLERRKLTGHLNT